LPFHNPYNFIPTPDRSGVLDDLFAGDYNPVLDMRNMPEDISKMPREDHSRYWSERYTGTIPVVLKTRTPMFITDPATKRLLAGTEGQSNAHYCYDTLDYIPSTALKGMLSSAYEAITNSRYRVFKKTQHNQRLGYRDGFRRVFCAKTPWECVHDSILPAAELEKLSPADRLFGWVPQEKGKKGAWKGKIRISDGIYSPSRDEPHNAIEIFRSPITLAILGTPKPAQFRFYLGDDKGEPQGRSISKLDASYRDNKKLRGRKVYLHQIVDNGNYWSETYRQSHTSNIKYAVTEKTGQNRSLSSWIPAKKMFKFDIKVENLNRIELGAILTLLTLHTLPSEEDYCFKLGYAKPFGLGSVSLKLNIKDTEVINIYSGEELEKGYRYFNFSLKGLGKVERDEIVYDYKKLIADKFGDTLDPSFAEICIDKIPDSWKNCECTKEIILEDEEITKKFSALWETLLKENAQTLSLNEFFSDYFKGYTINELEEVYLSNLKTFHCLIGDAKWMGLSFIKDLLSSMKGFRETEVYYPRNNYDDNGYEWFVNNERYLNRYGYSLPKMDKCLEETP
jgi:hypothetical protein